MLSRAYAAGGTTYEEDQLRWQSRYCSRMRVCGLAHTYFRAGVAVSYAGEPIRKGMVPTNVLWKDGTHDGDRDFNPTGFTLADYDGTTNIVIAYPGLNPDVWAVGTVYVVVIRLDGLVDGRNDNALMTMFQPTIEILEDMVLCTMPELDLSLTGTRYMISTGAVFYGDENGRGRPTISNGHNCMGVYRYPWGL